MGYELLITELKKYEDFLVGKIESLEHNKELYEEFSSIIPSNEFELRDLLDTSDDKLQKIITILPSECSEKLFYKLLNQTRYLIDVFSKEDLEELPQYKDNVTKLHDIIQKLQEKVSDLKENSIVTDIKDIKEKKNVVSNLLTKVDARSGYLEIIDDQKSLSCLDSMFQQSAVSANDQLNFLKQLCISNSMFYRQNAIEISNMEKINNDQVISTGEDQVVSFENDQVIDIDFQVAENTDITVNKLQFLDDFSTRISNLSSYLEESDIENLQLACKLLEGHRGRLKEVISNGYYETVISLLGRKIPNLEDQGLYYWTGLVLKLFLDVLKDISDVENIISSSNVEDLPVYIELLNDYLATFRNLYASYSENNMEEQFESSDENLQIVSNTGLLAKSQKSYHNKILFLLNSNDRPYIIEDLENFDSGKIPLVKKTISGVIKNLQMGNILPIKQVHSDEFHKDYRIEYYRQYTGEGAIAIPFMNIRKNVILILGVGNCSKSEMQNTKPLDSLISSRLRDTNYQFQYGKYLNIIDAGKAEELFQEHFAFVEELKLDSDQKGGDFK